MTARDFLAIAVGNMWRMKLRAILTTAGVTIAIAAFVAMLSFGAGNRRNVTREFTELGLFTTVQVYPPEDDGVAEADAGGGGGARPVLDEAAVERLTELAGVDLAYPFDSFDVAAALADTQLATSAQAMPAAAARTRLAAQLVAGTTFASDSARTALVSRELLRDAGLDDDPAAAIGMPLVLTVRVASFDSAWARVVRGQSGRIEERLAAVRRDSLARGERRRRLRAVARDELGAAVGRFVDGYMHARATVSDTLTVGGVLKHERRGRLRIRAVVVPPATAARLTAGVLADDPALMLAAVQSGALFAGPARQAERSYPHVTLDLDPRAPMRAVRDSVEAMGFRTFSFAEQFDEIRKFFFFFDLALAAVGLVALVTAALGIINTMMMSITERRREIGVLESLGADARAIRILFLAESAMIGAAGAVAGIVFGWLVTRVASAVAQLIMAREGIDGIELFATPLWLVATAFLFGVAVSLAAGLYPAARAARVDPVEALRGE